MTIALPAMQADLGVVGGSGLYRFFDNPIEVIVKTPWGSASAPITVGHVGNSTVAFVPRHGADHEFPPHRVPYGRTSGRCTRSESHPCSRRARRDHSRQRWNLVTS